MSLQRIVLDRDKSAAVLTVVPQIRLCAVFRFAVRIGLVEILPRPVVIYVTHQEDGTIVDVEEPD